MEFLSYIREHGLLPMPMLKTLCECVRQFPLGELQVKEILIEENTVQPVSSPVNVSFSWWRVFFRFVEIFMANTATSWSYLRWEAKSPKIVTFLYV